MMLYLALDLGTGKVTHGLGVNVYGFLLQGLSSVVGFLGDIPCHGCPFTDPFKNVQAAFPSLK